MGLRLSAMMIGGKGLKVLSLLSKSLKHKPDFLCPPWHSAVLRAQKLEWCFQGALWHLAALIDHMGKGKKWRRSSRISIGYSRKTPQGDECVKNGTHHDRAFHGA